VPLEIEDIDFYSYIFSIWIRIIPVFGLKCQAGNQDGGIHTMRLETNKDEQSRSDDIPRSRNRVADVVAGAKKWRIALFVPK
jgi:hypothetical protein